MTVGPATTPDRLRSLTHNLALVTSDGVAVRSRVTGQVTAIRRRDLTLQATTHLDEWSANPQPDTFSAAVE